MILNRSVLKQSLLALSFDLGGLFAGRLAIIFTQFLQSAPWVLALFPAMITVRGTIGGVLAGRLSTMLHTGEIEPRLRGNTEQFYSFIRGVFSLTLVDSLLIGLLSFGVNLLAGVTDLQNLPYFLTISVLTCMISVTIGVPIASSAAIIVFKRGLDPSIIVYPLMSTVEDILVTTLYVTIVRLALLYNTLFGMALTVVILQAFIFFMIASHRRERVFRRTLMEGVPAVLLTSLLGTFGGTILASLKEQIEEIPSILVLYPSLIDTLGDIGSILGSMQTAKLALGYVQSFRNLLKGTLIDLISVETAAFLMHVVFGVVAFLLGSATGLAPNLMFLVSIALITNVITFSMISMLSLATAIQTFKFGLDPDNLVIPMVTSVSDLVATTSLWSVIQVLGVG
jgi:mgtE-like transporter